MHGTEVALVLGPALVRYRDANGIQDVKITKGTLYRFTFPPKVAHAFGALGPEPMFLVGFNTECTTLSTQTHSQTTYSERMTLPSSYEGAA